MPAHRVLKGSLEENLLNVVSDEYAEDCDKAHKGLNLEIVRELDRRRKEIAALPTTSIDTSSYTKISIGNTFMLEKVAVTQPQSGWQSELRGWIRIHKLYARIKGTPTDANWKYLDRLVKGIIVDDQDRVVYGKNMYLDKDSGSSLEKLAAAVNLCLENESCEAPSFDAVKAFTDSQPYCGYYVKKLASSEDRSEKRAALARFQKRLEADSRRYGIRKNPTVRKGSAGTYLLPLDGSVFNDSLPQIQRFIESVWTTQSSAVKVNWEDKSLNKGIFSFSLSPDAGQRAYVDHSEKVIQLFAEGKAKSVAHEIGHVLGFPDNYFTVWQPETCSYLDQYRDDDLMSNSDQGHTLPQHWQQLSIIYP